MLTLLQIVTHHCQVTGLPVPAKVVGGSDKHSLQMLGLMTELLDDLERRQPSEANTREATFVSVANESQGALSTIADEGFIQFIPDTFFNRTTNLAVATGLTPGEWQALKAGPGAAGPYYRVRLRGGNLYITPTPPAGETFAFEYQSRFYVLDTSAEYAGAWAADGDQLALPDSIGRAWLKFAWKREKGLDYAEDQISYEQTLDAFFRRDNGPREINMAGRSGKPSAGVIVPIGSWNLP